MSQSESRHRELLKKELDELRNSGEVYQYKREPRCRICRNEEFNSPINKMLANGLTYAEIERMLAPMNRSLPPRQRVGYEQIRNHAAKHFATDNAAQAVYRQRLEKRAEEAGVDFVNGVGTAVTPLALFDVILQKGYEKAVEQTTDVPLDLSMRAAEKLHDISQSGQDEKYERLQSQFYAMVQAVRQVVPEQYWEEIVRRTESQYEGEAIEASSEGVDEDGLEDEIDAEYDPVDRTDDGDF